MGKKNGSTAKKAPKKKKASATEDTVKKPRAEWTPEDEQKLMAGIVRRKSTTANGGNFRSVVFNEVAKELNPPMKGIPKTGQMCKNKYAQLKRLWEVVIRIHNKSGWPAFHREFGANITPERENNWNEYVKANPKAKRFRNKGYEYYDYFDALMPLGTTLPKELNVCRIGRTVGGTDEEEDDSDGEREGSDDDGEGSQNVVAEMEGTQLVPAATQRDSPEWDSRVMSQQLGQPKEANQEVQSPASNLSRQHSDISIATTNSALALAGRKRGASETPLPKEKPSDKRTKPLAPSTPAPRHTQAPVSSDRAKAITALSEIGSGMKEFNQHAFAMLGSSRAGNVNDTPSCLAGAVKAMETEKVWLPLDLHIKLQDLFEKDKAAVVSYRNMNPDDKEFRRTWILHKLGVPIPPGYDILSDTLFPITPPDPFALYLPDN
ncbi:hypothetical protein PQX77_003589 [Marasmius sp. AFHP31]|nr:hypothetical protein PQX77_003589 [Marasmius sp. AFHP31]